MGSFLALLLDVQSAITHQPHLGLQELKIYQAEVLFIAQQSHDLGMDFASFWQLYRDDMKERLRENTVRTKDYIVELKVLPYFGKKKLADITAADIGILRLRNCC